MGPRLVVIWENFQLTLLYFRTADYCSEGVAPKEQKRAGGERAQDTAKGVRKIS